MRQILELREAHQQSLTEMEELRKFQSSTFDTNARRKLIEDQNTILELSGGVWCVCGLCGCVCVCGCVWVWVCVGVGVGVWVCRWVCAGVCVGVGITIIIFDMLREAHRVHSHHSPREDLSVSLSSSSVFDRTARPVGDRTGDPLSQQTRKHS